MFTQGFATLMSRFRPDAVLLPRVARMRAIQAEGEASQALNCALPDMLLSERLHDPDGWRGIQQSRRRALEALLAVPDSYREGSFGLGAGKLRTVFSIVLPSAMPGILSGVILATGRIVGETAALLYTAGSVAAIPAGADALFDSTRTLAVHMYILSSEGLHVNEAYGTAVVLLVLVLCINALSSALAKKLTKA